VFKFSYFFSLIPFSPSILRRSSVLRSLNSVSTKTKAEYEIRLLEPASVNPSRTLGGDFCRGAHSLRRIRPRSVSGPAMPEAGVGEQHTARHVSGGG